MKRGKKGGCRLGLPFRYLARVLLPFGFAGLLLVCAIRSPVAQERCKAEDYCERCHDPHEGVDMNANTCLSCHEMVRRGTMGLYPWYTSEAALAGICCVECHKPNCEGDDCLSCHNRHADPLR
jgi:hypothetical protein